MNIAQERSTQNLVNLGENTLPKIPIRVETDISERPDQTSFKLLSTSHDSRVAIAQITTDPGSIEQNTQKIIACIHQAREQGCTLVVFPELTIPAYSCMDLAYNKQYLIDNKEALESIRQASQGICVVVGFYDFDLDTRRPGGIPELHNSAAINHDGKMRLIQDKTHYPNTEIFREKRYTVDARPTQVVTIDGRKIGVTVCEDIWAKKENYAVDPVKMLVDQGADLIVNLSASPFHIGKQYVREELIRETALQHHVPVVYANLTGSFDGFEGEVVFDGRSIVASEDGTIIGRGAAFKEELYVVDLEKKSAVATPQLTEIEELYEALVLGVRDYFRRIGPKAGFDKAIIALSGGIDSAVTAAIAVEALGSEKVLGVTLPSKFSSDGTFSDAGITARNLGIDMRTVPIQGQVDGCLTVLRSSDPELAAAKEDVAEENVQARMRMIDAMYYANKLKGIVLNTGNKTELALNNCTIYGDMVGGFSVLADVDKDRVYELAEYRNKRAGWDVIPRSTIDRVPAAELKENQTDAHVMGDEPQRLAPMVREIVEENLSCPEAIERFSGQFPEQLIQKIFVKLDASEWKRRQASPGIRVTKHAFGIGRQMPIGHGYYK